MSAKTKNMRPAIVCLISALLAMNVGRTTLLAETWKQSGFAEFSKGRFEDGGSNIYVSARGRIQLINRLDLNNDGQIDLFIGNGHGHTENEDAYIYLNNGQEIDPLRRASIPTDSGVHGLVVDLNKDGKNDLVVVNSTGGVTHNSESYIYYGTAGGFVASRRQKLESWEAQSVAASDWNGDGWIDLAFACANLDPLTRERGRSVIYWNSEQGFGSDRKTELPGKGMFALAADLNGDKFVDLALAHAEEIRIYWAARQGLDLDRPSRLSISGQHLSGGDLDGDGYSELVVVTKDGVSILQGSAEGPAANKSFQLRVTNPMQAVVADLNRDGRPDVAVTNAGQYGNEYTDSYIFWNKEGRVSVDRSTRLPTVNAQGISAGDLNGDGWPDLVISNHSSLDNLSIQSFIYWNREGAFQFARKSMLDTKGPVGNCIGDVNNDGAPDVVFFNIEGGLRAGYNPNFIYWGDGTRNYSVGRRTSLWAAYTVGTIQADFNDDGWVDLGSVEARYAEGRPDTLHGAYVWYGDSGGYSEQRRVVLSAQDAEGGGVTADLNRDGYLDLVIGAAEVGPAGKGGYVILYGGANGFSPNRRQVVPIGIRGLPPLIADFNRDGFLDMAAGGVGASGKRGMHLLYGSAQGFKIGEMVVTNADSGVAYLEAADFDRDGWLDLIVPTTDYPKNYESDMLVYYGSERGFSETRVTRLPHMNSLDPSVADFNRDGWLDIFVPNYRSNLHGSIPCYLYWGSPSGFNPKNRVDLPGDSGSASLAADFDGDRWTDIFLVNHKREGSRDHAGDPVNHQTNSFLYWNGPDGFQSSLKTDIPTSGPHVQMIRDPGNIYTRELAEVYVSPSYRARQDQERATRIQWKAETLLNTAVMFQVRTASRREALEQAEWKGPAGAGSWFQKPGPIPASKISGPWFQYRARLATPNGAATPVLTEVAVEFE